VEEKNEVVKRQEIIKLRLHFFYVTLILLAAIILLATTNWTGIEKFTDYLTAAGTMVSIVLGVLAIIYSFVSGDSISKSLGGVAAAATELQSARIEFSGVVEAASDLTEASRKSSLELNGLLDLVKQEVREIKAASAQLSESTIGIAKAVGQMPERLDKIHDRLEESLKSPKVKPISGVSLVNESLPRKVLMRSSNYGKALLYAVALSQSTGKSFSLSDGPFAGSDEYCYGYFLALNSAGIFDLETIDADKRIYKVTDFSITPDEMLQALQPIFDKEDVIAQILTELINQTKKMFDNGVDDVDKVE